MTTVEVCISCDSPNFSIMRDGTSRRVCNHCGSSWPYFDYAAHDAKEDLTFGDVDGGTVSFNPEEV